MGDVVSVIPNTPGLSHLAQIIQIAIAPVFLLAGLGAFLNVCVGRLARVIDRTRTLEPLILASRGNDHDRWVREIRLLDRRIGILNLAIALTVLAALLVAAVVILLFVAFLIKTKLGTLIALLFIAAMLSTAAGFATFLVETRISTRAMRVRNAIRDHKADEERG